MSCVPIIQQPAFCMSWCIHRFITAELYSIKDFQINQTIKDPSLLCEANIKVIKIPFVILLISITFISFIRGLHYLICRHIHSEDNMNPIQFSKNNRLNAEKWNLFNNTERTLLLAKSKFFYFLYFHKSLMILFLLGYFSHYFLHLMYFWNCNFFYSFNY